MDFNGEWYLSAFSRNERKVIIENYGSSLDCIEDFADVLHQLIALATANTCLSFNVSEDEKTANAVATFIFADESGWKQFCEELVKLLKGNENKQE